MKELPSSIVQLRTHPLPFPVPGQAEALTGLPQGCCPWISQPRINSEEEMERNSNYPHGEGLKREDYGGGH